VPEPELPVASVAVDVPLAHLDRPFDYAVTPEQDAEAVPGARVRVRFSGRLRDGFVLDRQASSDHEGRLAPLHKVVSSEPVLTAEVAALVRAVADHYAGTFADVMRLAVPPRHAATERAEPVPPVPLVEDPPLGPLPGYPTGTALLRALRDGRRPRALWQVTPSAAASGDWAAGLAEAARACAEGGRGAVLVVPDHRDLERLDAACTAVLGAGAFAVLVAEAGPAARYRAFLAARRGRVKVVIGTRAAAYAPVQDLGLVGVWDDGNDLLAEPRAPYPHARDVLALRAAAAGTGMLLAGYARTAEAQTWVERGWLVELAEERPAVRHTAPRIKVTADSDRALEHDPLARAARLPHEVFETVRAALPQGAVLVQVPRSGYRLALVCGDCREPVRCRFCSGPTRLDGPGPAPPVCTWCGRLQVDWACPICESRAVRAPAVGAERTAEELGRAFPQTPVRASVGGRTLACVPDTPSIVVATPGAEPPAERGYAAAVLLDTATLLLRPDLRAAEEALRRWLNAVALVRSGADGGTVIAVGESAGRALQALVRTDPAGFARRELVDRAEAGFPPAVRMVRVEGGAVALAEFDELIRLPSDVDRLGPVETDEPPATGEPVYRITLRAPRAAGPALVRAVQEVLAIRSARKSDGALRVVVDPVNLG
jgi:primosomal protein N' (replication factor Y) (superfamily II helicase)